MPSEVVISKRATSLKSPPPQSTGGKGIILELFITLIPVRLSMPALLHFANPN